MFSFSLCTCSVPSACRKMYSITKKENEIKLTTIINHILIFHFFFFFFRLVLRSDSNLLAAYWLLPLSACHLLLSLLYVLICPLCLRVSGDPAFMEPLHSYSLVLDCFNLGGRKVLNSINYTFPFTVLLLICKI